MPLKLSLIYNLSWTAYPRSFDFTTTLQKKGGNFMVLLTSLMDRPPTTAVALRKPDGLPVDTVLCWHLRKTLLLL